MPETSPAITLTWSSLDGVEVCGRQKCPFDGGARVYPGADSYSRKPDCPADPTVSRFLLLQLNPLRFAAPVLADRHSRPAPRVESSRSGPGTIACPPRTRRGYRFPSCRRS